MRDQHDSIIYTDTLNASRCDLWGASEFRKRFLLTHSQGITLVLGFGRPPNRLLHLLVLAFQACGFSSTALQKSVEQNLYIKQSNLTIRALVIKTYAVQYQKIMTGSL